MKALKRIILLLSVMSLGVLVAQPASADYLPGEKTQADQVDGIEMIHEFLRTEQFVPSRLEFRKMSSDAVADLVKISKSGSYHVAVRARAIQSLALYKNDERAVEAIDNLMKRHRPGQRLFPALVVAYGGVHGESAVDRLTGLARHKRDDVRMAAVVALGRFGGQDGYDTLLELVETEENVTVLARIKNYTQ